MNKLCKYLRKNFDMFELARAYVGIIIITLLMFGGLR